MSAVAIDPWNELSREWLEDNYPEAVFVIERLVAESDDARKEWEFYETEYRASLQEIDDAKADSAALREAGRRWLSETGPEQHINTAVGRHMMRVAIGDES